MLLLQQAISKDTRQQSMKISYIIVTILLLIQVYSKDIVKQSIQILQSYTCENIKYATAATPDPVSKKNVINSHKN